MQSIYDFNYFCCPECIFQSKEELLFQEHALQTHEQSRTFFQNSTDISYANDEQTFRDDEYILTEQNDFCKTEVNSDPLTAENYEPLKEIKTELLPFDNVLKASLDMKLLNEIYFVLTRQGLVLPKLITKFSF